MSNDVEISGGYPKGPPKYQNGEKRSLEPSDHFNYNSETINRDIKREFLIDELSRHLTRDINDPNLKDVPVTYKDEFGNDIPVFSGSTTHINPENNEDKQKIIDNGLDDYETSRVKKVTGDSNRCPPISPLQPFTRMDPSSAQISNLTTYNRTKLPVADLEFRKGFRHIFITRPECYIMAHNPIGLEPLLSEQAESDEDFSSCYSRAPHILKMLSPIYVTGSFSKNGINSNWNYLLSNRVQGMSVPTTTLTVNEDINKSVEGFTVMTPRHLESIQGSTLDLKFRDTKNLEVYEMLKMWMMYMYKRHKGVFAPPYNGYQYHNFFIKPQESGTPLNNSIIYHPYDRAEEYCASLFDIITNESMTKIIYWCKYYGIYPVSANPEGLNNDNNAPITEATVSAQFRYHYRLEGANKSLVEFNYNAGITDDMGRVNKAVEASYPFLLKHQQPGIKDSLTTLEEVVMDEYIGSSGMFTGSPYIILGYSQNDPLNENNGIITPYLQFMSLNKGKLNSEINLDIVNNRKETDGIIGII